MQKIAQNGTIQQKLIQYMQLALVLAQESHPDMVQGLSQDIMETIGAGIGTPAASSGVSSSTKLDASDNIAGVKQNEPTHVSNSREKAEGASQPEGNNAVNTGRDKRK